MREFKYVIQDELGIHARPAGMLAKMAKDYESEILITKGSKTIAATKLFMLLGLGVKQGEEVAIRIEGVDEDIVYEKLLEFFKKNL
jgi:phosphocarrier protein